MWFEVGVTSRELGFQQSELLSCMPVLCSSGLCSLSLRPGSFPPRSPSLPLFQCCCCSRPCLQMSTRTEQLFSMGARKPHTPPPFFFFYTYTLLHSLSCLAVSCIHNVFEQYFCWEENEICCLKIFLERHLSWNSIPSGLDEPHISFKHELMWLTNTHFLCPSPPLSTPPRCYGDTGLVAEWWRGSQGGGDLREAACRLLSVCVWAAVVSSPAKKHHSVSVALPLWLLFAPFFVSHLFFLLLSLQKPLPCPPPSSWALFADKKLPYPTR